MTRILHELLWWFKQSKAKSRRIFDDVMTSSNWNNFRVTGPLWGESTVYRWLPPQRPVTRCLVVFFDMRLNYILLSNQSRLRWFETTSHSLLRHSTDTCCKLYSWQDVIKTTLNFWGMLIYWPCSNDFMVNLRITMIKTAMLGSKSCFKMSLGWQRINHHNWMDFIIVLAWESGVILFGVSKIPWNSLKYWTKVHRSPFSFDLVILKLRDIP